MFKVLDISTPPITSYAHHTTCLSIISKNEKYLPWFLGNYIQLSANRNRTARWIPILDFSIAESAQLDPTERGPLSNCPLLEREELPKKLDGHNVTDIFINFLDNDYYIYTEIDCSYIHEYSRIGFHPIFLYGFDMSKRVFYAADFFANGIYKRITVRFDQVENGYLSVLKNGRFIGRFDEDQEESKYKYYFGVALFKYNNNVDIHFNLRQLISFLENYIHSKTTSSVYKGNQFLLKDTRVYGLDIYHKLQTEIRCLMDGANIANIDTRAIPVLYDHKTVMCMLINYLAKKGLLTNSQVLVERFRGVKQEAEITRNLFLRFRFTNNRQLLVKVCEHLDDLRQMEEYAFKELINELV